MQFDSFQDFVAMGGYGLYVWLSFGVSFAAIIALYISARIGKKQLYNEVMLQIERKQRVQAARKHNVVNINQALKDKQDESQTS